MCVIAASEKNVTKMTRERFRQCFETNSDGVGIMWMEDKELKIHKTLNQEEAWGKYSEVHDRFNKESPIVVHFRIGTQGPNNLDNCHPFVIDKETAFCHNGIISEYSKARSFDKSDTRLFNEAVLRKLPVGFLDNDAIRDMIKKHVSSNKLVFMTVIDGECKIAFTNKALGSIKDGIWYSNLYFDYDRYRTYGSARTSTSEIAKANQKKIDERKALLDKTTKTGGDTKPNTSTLIRKCSCCSEIIPLRDHALIVSYKGRVNYTCADCADDVVIAAKLDVPTESSDIMTVIPTIGTAVIDTGKSPRNEYEVKSSTMSSVTLSRNKGAETITFTKSVFFDRCREAVYHV